MLRVTIALLWIMVILEHRDAAKIVRIADFDRFNITKYDKYYGTMRGHLAKVNRTTSYLNVHMDIKVDIPAKAMIHYKLFKLDGGLYKETGIQFHKPLCDFLKVDYTVLFSPLLKNGLLKNFIKKCPITKGIYHFENVRIPSESFPMLPLWSSVGILYFDYNNKIIMECKSYCSVKEVVENI